MGQSPKENKESMAKKKICGHMSTHNSATRDVLVRSFTYDPHAHLGSAHLRQNRVCRNQVEPVKQIALAPLTSVLATYLHFLRMTIMLILGATLE